MGGRTRKRPLFIPERRSAAGKDFRYYMVFENEENLLPGAMSMSQFIDTVKAL